MSLTTLAVDMRGFGFAWDREPDIEWWLHIQCCWRIDAAVQILTGSDDLYRSADPPYELVESRDGADGCTLQDFRLNAVFGHPPEKRRGKDSINNATAALVVTAATATPCGDLTIALTGGYVLRVFPSGSRGEQWRLFQRGDLESHYVLEW